MRKHNLQVKQIVITHAHIDHVGGAMKLRAATGAPILLNQNDYALLKMLDVQAAWIGVPNAGNGGDRSQRYDWGNGERRGARRECSPHARSHGRQHLPVLPCRKRN